MINMQNTSMVFDEKILAKKLQENDFKINARTVNLNDSDRNKLNTNQKKKEEGRNEKW